MRHKRRNKCSIIIFLFFIFFLMLSNKSYGAEAILEKQQEELGISSFLKESSKYTKEVFPEINTKELLNATLKGEVSHEGLYKGISVLLGKEVVNSLQLIGSVLMIILIHSVLKGFADGLENEGVSKMIYYVQYILIVIAVMANFSEVLLLVNETIQNLVGFMYSLIPVLITLMITTGSLVSANLVQPIILFIIGLIGNLVQVFILPMLMVSTVLGLISNISEQVQIDKLSKYFKSSIVWLLGILVTIFVSVLSIEGTLGSTVDGVTAKTAKAAVSTLIPVVGKVLGDAVDTVMGCANILKNGVGIVGVIVIIAICIMPIIKLGVLFAVYSLMTALAEPIADKRIVNLLEQIKDTFKILLGITFSISTMLIIGVTIIIKMSNSSMMYR